MTLICITAALIVLFEIENWRYFSSLNHALNMTTTVNNMQIVTIESLFKEGETEAPYFQLLQRATDAKMGEMDFHQALMRERKQGIIDLDFVGNVKLMGDSEPLKTHYETQITEGVKCANNLCSAVLRDMQVLLDTVSTSADNIEIWEKRLNDSIAANAKLHTRCGKPEVAKWDNRKGKYYMAAYASANAHINNAAFITISCELIQED